MTKSEVGPKFKYLLKYDGTYYKVGLLDMTYGLINDSKKSMVYHPDGERKGLYHFETEETAIKEINAIYEKKANKVARPVTEFQSVIPNQTFKEFNAYINSLDNSKQK